MYGFNFNLILLISPYSDFLQNIQIYSKVYTEASLTEPTYTPSNGLLASGLRPPKSQCGHIFQKWYDKCIRFSQISR